MPVVGSESIYFGLFLANFELNSLGFVLFCDVIIKCTYWIYKTFEQRNNGVSMIRRKLD